MKEVKEPFVKILLLLLLCNVLARYGCNVCSASARVCFRHCNVYSHLFLEIVDCWSACNREGIATVPYQFRM